MKTCIKCGTLFDKQQCHACHKKLRLRWLANNIEKNRETKKKWYAANVEKQKEYTRAFSQSAEGKSKRDKWRSSEANRKKERAYCEKWYSEHVEIRKAYNKKWRESHMEYVRIKSLNRNARKKTNGGTLSNGLVMKLLKLQRGKCACCGKPLGKQYHMDHIMPIALGGPNEDWNMQLLRSQCNQKKSAKHPIEFMQSRGFLL